MNPFPHDPSYGQAESDSAAWQQDADAADDAERLQTSREDHRDYFVELHADTERDNEPTAPQAWLEPTQK